MCVCIHVCVCVCVCVEGVCVDVEGWSKLIHLFYVVHGLYVNENMILYTNFVPSRTPLPFRVSSSLALDCI